MFRAFRYKLNPTPAQESTFEQYAGVVRLIYNLAWEQRRDHWRQYHRSEGRHISFPSQCRELTALRAQFGWIASVERICQEQALRDLDRAFQTFFSKRGGYPKPRVKGMNDAFRFRGSPFSTRKLSGRWSEVLLPKIGWVKYRDTRQIVGTRKNVTITGDASGWHISFACEIEHGAIQSSLPSIGIDRGVANTLALSTGEMLSLPKSLEAIDRKKRQAQKVLARKKRGSTRRMKALRRVAKLSARSARVRRDWHHKTALCLATRFGAVVLEDLNIRNMTASASGTITEPGRKVAQKSGLNRSILNQGWYAFEMILAYKLEERGGTLVKVPAAYSSQTCSSCGTVDARSRESQSVFRCQHCGFAGHADVNAANIILRRNTASMRVEGHQLRSGETRTESGLSAENRSALAA